MADWFIATEGVKVVKDSASLWPQIITAVSSAGAALGGVCLTHRFTRRREERATADKASAERLYLATELAFLLERYASGWTYLRWTHLEKLSQDNRIPVLELSAVSGDWRVLPPRQIFKIRSLEADHVALVSRISKSTDSDNERFELILNFECFQTAVRAFILAARLRREVGLPDSAHLRDKSGVLWGLREARQRRWSTEARLRRFENEAFESITLRSSQQEDEGQQ
ncbi:hypothetical protein GNN13_04220 [Salmonella enterica]|nr:hypothetical protein [Salmonella enterica]EGM2029662.1 hypothetical protein [Salmonella enterica]ELV2721440.1 hypothetical protein [Salmonella enterica]HDN6545867.1 hypothetical protein [Salmonella enterica subsp. enterica serovar Chester]